jgi:hypothetical protein
VGLVVWRGDVRVRRGNAEEDVCDGGGSEEEEADVDARGRRTGPFQYQIHIRVKIWHQFNAFVWLARNIVLRRLARELLS